MRTNLHHSLAYAALAWIAAGCTCLAQVAPTPPADPTDRSLSDRLAGQTLGGVMFWGDELFFHDWRVQRNTLTGHCRLLDGNNQRYASGTFDQCVQMLSQIRAQKQLPPMSGRAVILLHGLGGVRATMSPIASQLEKAGYHTFNVSYPSTQGGLADHARALASVVAHLDGIKEINFVTHSAGCLVLRHYLGDMTDPAHSLRPDPRIRRIVMIAPPNHGSEKARSWGDSRLFAAVTGETGVQLGIDWPSVAPRLATPQCDFGIIAGGKGNDQGFSSKLPGDDDGLLSVSTTLLAGARDFLLLHHRHNLLLVSGDTCECTRRFLDCGYFIAPEARTPIVQ